MNQNEVLEKQYFNVELERKLEEVISKDKYGDFAIILREIFQRRAYEFEFSENEILNEARRFERNVDDVHFGPASEFSSLTTMGVFKSGRKTIVVNQDYYLNREKHMNGVELGEEMFETLTHETYHAINYMSDSVLGLMYYDRESNQWEGTALNEIVTETAADRTSFGRNSRDAERFRRDTSGYGSITFATNLLAAALGTTEKELLKAGIQHRGTLEQLTFSKFPQDRNFGTYARDSYLAAFEQSLNTIYNIDYNHDRSRQETPEEFRMKKDMLKGALTGMYAQSYRLANFQISVSPDDIDRKFVAESLYRFSKLERITKDSLDDFARRYGFSEQEKNEVFRAINQPRMDLGTRVVGMDMLQKQGYKIKSPAELDIQKSLAKRALIFEGNNITMLNQVYGIELPKMIGVQEAHEITADFEYSNYMLKEDFDNGRRWDDGAAGLVTGKIFIEDMVKKGIKSRSYLDFLEKDTAQLPIINTDEKKYRIEDPDKTEEIPIIDDPDKTEEIPIVDDPDKTEEIPIIDDEITEKIPVVNLENSQAQATAYMVSNDEDKKSSKNIISNITNKLKDFFNKVKNRNQKLLTAAKEESKVEDKSSYYADLVSTANEYPRKEPTFDERYKVAPEDLKPLQKTPIDDGRITKDKEKPKEDEGLTMD